MKTTMPMPPTDALPGAADVRPPARGRGISLLGAAVTVVAASLVGCGTSPPTRFYTLDPVAPPAASTPMAAHPGPPLRVRAVHLPPAWDRLELIREVGPGQVQVREFDQWAAPLGRSARQTLAQDLATRLPAGAVLVSDAGPGSGGAAGELSVDILSLRVDGRTASMQASWSVRQSPTDAWRNPPPATLEVPLTGDGGDATALAVSRLIGELADRIASDLGAGAPAN